MKRKTGLILCAAVMAACLGFASAGTNVFAEEIQTEDNVLNEEANLEMAADATYTSAQLSGYDRIKINGYVLTVNGDFDCKVNLETGAGGKLIVKGNMKATKKIDGEGGTIQVDGNYTQASGTLEKAAKVVVKGDMTFEGDSQFYFNGGTLSVDGDFIWDSSKDTDYLDSYTSIIKGDIIQKEGTGQVGFGKLILDGTEKQTLDFLSGSYIEKLEAKNTKIKVTKWLNVFSIDTDFSPEMTGDLYTSMLKVNDKVVTLPHGLVLTGDKIDKKLNPYPVHIIGKLTVNGNMEARGKVVLENGTLTVHGNYEQKAETLEQYIADKSADVTIDGDAVFSGGGAYNLSKSGNSITVGGDVKYSSSKSVGGVVSNDPKYDGGNWTVTGNVSQDSKAGRCIFHKLYLKTSGAKLTLPNGKIDTLELNGKKAQFTLTPDGCWDKLIENKAPEADKKTDEKTQVTNFVSRMYTVALGREAETGGLNDWSGQLLEGKSDGATLARGFICGQEFKNKNYNNEQYVDALYKTFFNRDPDEGGKSNWMNALESGTSREEVLAGFVNSLEFANLCDQFGIARGTMEKDGSSIYNKGVRDFVLRNYEKALGRKGETVGVEDWAYRINTKQMGAIIVAQNFFHSEEFLNKNTTDEQYVEILYQTFLGRASDASGKAYWLGQLNGVKTRDEVLEGFANSQEFANIMAQYGL